MSARRRFYGPTHVQYLSYRASYFFGAFATAVPRVRICCGCGRTLLVKQKSGATAVFPSSSELPVQKGGRGGGTPDRAIARCAPLPRLSSSLS